MDAILHIGDESSNSSGVLADLEPLPPKQHLPPPTTAAEINSQMTGIFDALDPEDHRYHHSRLTVNLRKNLLNNAKSALHRNRHVSRAKFTLFDKLPAEIRARIWRMAANAPQIIELESYTSKVAPHPQYRPLKLPPTLLACHESHHETLLAARVAIPENIANEVISTTWLNYDTDIFHIRDMDFSERGAYVSDPFYDPQYDQIRRTNLFYIREEEESDKWEGRPACFEEIEALAVSRDLLVRTLDPSECIIRHFFPKLRVLIVLIDDAFDIDRVWDVDTTDAYPYRRYERALRFGFVQDSLGPFKEVVNNVEYKDAVIEETREMFREEEELFEWYNAPEVVVLSAQMRPGNERWDGGRYPSNYVLEEDDDEELVLKRLGDED